MINVRYRYIYQDVDRHGNVRVYFWRRPGPKIRVREQIGTEEFSKRYHALMAGDVPAPKRCGPNAGTFRWLVVQYLHSTEFKGLGESTQRTRRRILEHCCAEPIAPGRDEVFADFPLDRMTTKALRVLRDRKADRPQAANSRVRALRPMFSWAMQHEHVANNIARDLERIAAKSDGHATWTDEDVAAFEARHPIGTKARLAFALLLYTGMRKSDVVELGRQHVKDGWISKPQYKGRSRHAQMIEIPMLESLAEIIAASETGDLTYLVTAYGKPFTIAGFGNWFRARCDEAGVHGKAAHGLRKMGATRAAEGGATSQQLMAMFGWRSLSEAELYTKAAERKRLARDGMARAFAVGTGTK
jgi:integrase